MVQHLFPGQLEHEPLHRPRRPQWHLQVQEQHAGHRLLSLCLSPEVGICLRHLVQRRHLRARHQGCHQVDRRRIRHGWLLQWGLGCVEQRMGTQACKFQLRLFLQRSELQPHQHHRQCLREQHHHHPGGLGLPSECEHHRQLRLQGLHQHDLCLPQRQDCGLVLILRLHRPQGRVPPQQNDYRELLCIPRLHRAHGDERQQSHLVEFHRRCLLHRHHGLLHRRVEHQFHRF